MQPLCNHSCPDPTPTQVDQQVGSESVLTAAGQSLSAALSPISQPHVACSMFQRPYKALPLLLKQLIYVWHWTFVLCSRNAGNSKDPPAPPSACPLHTQTSSAGASPQQTTAHRCSHCRAIETECSECPRRKNKSRPVPVHRQFCLSALSRLVCPLHCPLCRPLHLPHSYGSEFRLP